MMNNFMMMGGDGPSPTFTYNGVVTSTTDSTSYSFNSVPIGTASANRLIVLCISTGNGTIEDSLVTGVTVGGIAAERVTRIPGYWTACETWAVSVPTGTTANIGVTCSTGTLRCAVFSYSLYGLRSTLPRSINTFGGENINTGNTPVFAPRGGIVIAHACTTQAGTTTATWTNITSNYAQKLENSRWKTAASIQVSAPGVVIPTLTLDAEVTLFSMNCVVYR